MVTLIRFYDKKTGQIRYEIRPPPGGEPDPLCKPSSPVQRPPPVQIEEDLRKPPEPVQEHPVQEQVSTPGKVVAIYKRPEGVAPRKEKRDAAFKPGLSTRKEKAVHAASSPQRPQGTVILDFRDLSVKIPCYSDTDYDEDVLEYILAVDSYIRRTFRKFPTHQEHLLIAKALGYHK